MRISFNNFNSFFNVSAESSKSLEFFTRSPILVAVAALALLTILIARMGIYKPLNNFFQAKNIPSPDPTIKEISSREGITLDTSKSQIEEIDRSESQRDEIDESQSKIHENSLIVRTLKNQSLTAEIAQFILATSAATLGYEFTPKEKCHSLSQAQWPDEKLKAWFIPEYLSELILKGYDGMGHMGGIGRRQEQTMPNNGFEYREISIDYKRIFGQLDSGSNTERISPYLAKAIGLAIRKAGLIHISELKTQRKRNMPIELVGLAVYFPGQCSISTIGSILPHLKDIPGLTSLEFTFSDNGFGDEHTDDFSEIIKTNSFLKNIKINYQGIIQQRKDFEEKWENILKDRMNLDLLSSLDHKEEN